MNKKRLIQAAIDLAVAVLPGYIVLLAPPARTDPQPSTGELPGKILMVQIDALIARWLPTAPGSLNKGAYGASESPKAAPPTRTCELLMLSVVFV